MFLNFSLWFSIFLTSGTQDKGGILNSTENPLLFETYFAHSERCVLCKSCCSVLLFLPLGPSLEKLLTSLQVKKNIADRYKSFSSRKQVFGALLACLCVRWWCTTLLNETSLSKKTHCSKLISKYNTVQGMKSTGFSKCFVSKWSQNWGPT